MSLLGSLSQSSGFDLYAAMNETFGPIDVSPYRKLSFGIDSAQQLGFDTSDDLFLVRCSDLLFAHFAKVIPDYDHYILCEYDVDFTETGGAFLDKLTLALRGPEFSDVDLVGCDMTPRGENWPHTALCARKYNEVWGVFFPFIVVSRRAIGTLLQARRDEGPADLEPDARIFCEAFVATVLRSAGGYRTLDLWDMFPASYDFDFFYFGLPMLAGAPVGRRGEPLRSPQTEILHPVYDASGYLAKRFQDAVDKGSLDAFLTILADQSLPIPAELRETYATRAAALFGGEAAPASAATLANPALLGSAQQPLEADVQQPPQPVEAPPVATIPVVLLAGGLGTRLREETEVRPKPMVEVGGQPMLWHIMKIYAAYGFDEFVVCLGYKGEVIKSFFLDYHLKKRSLTVDLSTGDVDPHGESPHDAWRVHLLDTGEATLTGGRVKRAAEYLGKRRFMLTYGDGVCDVDIGKLLAFHERSGKLATITAVRPPARFGGLTIEGDLVRSFDEKPQIGEGWINGGFMVFEPEVANYIDDDTTILERAPLERLAADGQLVAYRHSSFWHCMDTVRDLTVLRELWDGREAPWKVW